MTPQQYLDTLKQHMMELRRRFDASDDFGELKPIQRLHDATVYAIRAMALVDLEASMGCTDPALCRAEGRPMCAGCRARAVQKGAADVREK